ncbi:MAG: hypothetical protein QOH51_2092 [Acidobacteriota bacterium]|jgi:hypothetical protein|nr:hypothetical protein [Acidobacteriota bacterium]
MAETNERAEGAGGEDAPREGDDELRAEEESAEAMEAEVPHPSGYTDTAQEQPS